MNAHNLKNSDQLNTDQKHIIALSVDKIREKTGVAIDDKSIFAIVTDERIYLYDTENPYPFYSNLRKIAMIYPLNMTFKRGHKEERSIYESELGFKKNSDIIVLYKSTEYLVLKNPSKRLIENVFIRTCVWYKNFYLIFINFLKEGEKMEKNKVNKKRAMVEKYNFLVLKRGE